MELDIITIALLTFQVGCVLSYGNPSVPYGSLGGLLGDGGSPQGLFHAASSDVLNNSLVERQDVCQDPTWGKLVQFTLRI